MTDPGSNRRQWLVRALWRGAAGTALASLGWALLDVWLGAGRFSSNRWVEVGSLGEMPDEGVVPFPAVRAAVVRRGQRIAAVSLECTHLGCLLTVTEQGFLCPCHGSEFGPLGDVYSGPATEPLPWHALEVRRGRIRIRTGRRLPGPRWVRADDARGT